MLAVTVSPKFQVVIPQAVREQLQIEAGQKLQVISFDKRIELLPIESPTALRGFLAGIDTTISRDTDRT
jgi:AbrB family looped-hinge helix DNA binding protein